MLHHLLHPRSVRYVLLDNDCMEQMKTKTFLNEKYDIIRSKVAPLVRSWWLQSRAYTTTFSNRHYAALVAFTNSRAVVILDGYYHGASLWQDWVTMFVWKLTGQTVDIVCHNDLVPFAEVAAMRGEDQPDSTSWHCYIASDAIDQGDNGTECGFLKCMNVATKVYESGPANATLENSRQLTIPEASRDGEFFVPEE